MGEHPVDTVVIGCGIAGASTAWHLALHSVQVVVLEAANIANASGECASTVNAGLVCAVGRGSAPLPLDRQLIEGTLEQFEDLAQRGHAIEFQRRGWMKLCQTAGEFALARAQFDELKAQGADVRLLDGAAARSLEPSLSDRVVGALFSPVSATVHPRKTLLAIVQEAEALGVRVRAHHSVTALSHDGRAWVVRGARSAQAAGGRGVFEIRAKRVVIAAGHASCHVAGLVSATAAQSVPVVPVVGQMWGTPPVGPSPALRCLLTGFESSHFWSRHATAPARSITHASPDQPQLTRHLYGKQAPDGTFMFGGDRVALPPHPAPAARPFLNAAGVARNQRHVEEFLPSLRGVGAQRWWSGVMPFTPDGGAIVGEVPTAKGLFVCSGMSSAGLMMGAEGGRLLALAMQGDGHARDALRPVAPSRFLAKARL